MRTLKVVPMYPNGGMKDENERHGKPIEYEVHDVTDEFITRFPEIIDENGFRRQASQRDVTFKTEAKAQAWIDQQTSRENTHGKAQTD